MIMGDRMLQNMNDVLNKSDIGKYAVGLLIIII